MSKLIQKLTDKVRSFFVTKSRSELIEQTRNKILSRTQTIKKQEKPQTIYLVIEPDFGRTIHVYLNEEEAQEMVDSYNARDFRHTSYSYRVETMTTEDGLDSPLKEYPYWGYQKTL